MVLPCGLSAQDYCIKLFDPALHKDVLAGRTPFTSEASSNGEVTAELSEVKKCVLVTKTVNKLLETLNLSPSPLSKQTYPTND